MVVRQPQHISRLKISVKCFLKERERERRGDDGVNSIYVVPCFIIPSQEGGARHIQSFLVLLAVADLHPLQIRGREEDTTKKKRPVMKIMSARQE